MEEKVHRFKGFEDLLKRQAETIPDRPALIFFDREKKTMTYRQFYHAVLQRTAELKGKKKTCIGIAADGGIDCVIEIFASVLSGMQVVMLGRTIHKDYLQELITYTDMDILIGYDGSAADFEMGGGVRNCEGRILFFTSGTTERAKAVVLTDRSLMASAYNGGMMLPLKREDVLLNMLPLDHVFGFVCGLLWGLSCGASVALGRGPRHYLDDCDYFRPTALSAVPMLLGFLLKNNLLNEELRIILVGAGDCPDQLMDAVKAKGIRLSFGYGLTETSSGVAISTSGDPRAMAVCPDDRITIAEDGEILVESSTCMMIGYYKHYEDTGKVLKNGVLYTGDLGRFDENGLLHITGRKKEILVLPDGTKIFLPEYESELAGILHTDKLAAVLKNNSPVLVLEHSDMTEKEILDAVSPFMNTQPRGSRISEVIILNHAMPKTETGKIRRWELEKEIQSWSQEKRS